MRHLSELVVVDTRGRAAVPPGPPARQGRLRGRIVALAAVLALAASAAHPPCAQTQTLPGRRAAAQPQKRMVDPVGEYVPIKPKVFKDLKHIEITDYDRERARNIGQMRALVHMKGDSALEPGEFKLADLALEFMARDPQGVVYKFKGHFTRGGDLYASAGEKESVLRGHLATYLKGELLRQENLNFKFQTGE